MIYEITERDIPRLYQLCYANKQLEVEVHKDVFIWLNKIDERILKAMCNEFGFKTFHCTPQESVYGFDGCIKKRISEKDEFIIFSAQIPFVQTFTEEECFSCDGTKIFCGSPCQFCDGTGKESRTDTLSAYRISASLKFLLMASSELVPLLSNQRELQLVHLELTTIIGTYGGDIHGFLSKTLVLWLKGYDREKFYEQVASKILQNMQETYKTLFPVYRSMEVFEHRVLLNEEGNSALIHIDCPGNACGLDPNQSIYKENEGYQIGGHNVDSPVQQLQLLVGLATLCELYDEAHK
jgi:hypothetical protein